MPSKEIDGVLVDMDGTLYRGTDPIPGAGVAIEALRDSGVRVLFLTNSATSSIDRYVARLADCGVDARRDDVLTSAESTAVYLAERHSDASTFVVGEGPLVDALDRQNVPIVTDPAGAEVLVVGLDRELTYETLTDALRAVEVADLYVATNPDGTRPGDGGLVPSTGALLGTIEGMSGRQPDTVVGKPSRHTAAVATERLGVEPSRCLVVGDRLDTDVRMGLDAGTKTALVLSGVTDRERLAGSDVEPTYVLDSIADLPEVMEL